MSRPGLGHRLRLWRLRRTGSTPGFTLVELLIVLVIVVILSGLIAGLVNRFSNQARVAAAKAVVISAARECLRWLVEAEGRPFDRGTTAGEGLVLSPADPGICGAGTMFQVTFDEIPGAAYRVTINSDGSLPRDCSGFLCAGGRW